MSDLIPVNLIHATIVRNRRSLRSMLYKLQMEENPYLPPKSARQETGESPAERRGKAFTIVSMLAMGAIVMLGGWQYILAVADVNALIQFAAKSFFCAICAIGLWKGNESTRIILGIAGSAAIALGILNFLTPDPPPDFLIQRLTWANLFLWSTQCFFMFVPWFEIKSYQASVRRIRLAME